MPDHLIIAVFCTLTLILGWLVGNYEGLADERDYQRRLREEGADWDHHCRQAVSVAQGDL